ncbi:HAMP domain-containing protein, partial [Streptomyces sp. DvalAA-14]|uniref:sensor histidine kinase n=1 Tax=unclassified Streptomyces TaxID=2593676 RepID=UPI00081B52B7
MSGAGGRTARTGPGRRFGLSITASLVALAVVPATALIVLWASGSAVLLTQWLKAAHVGHAAETTDALTPAIGEFQKERRLTVLLLATHGSRTALDAQRRTTDVLLADFRKADAAYGQDGSAQFRAQLATVRSQLGELTAERKAVDAGQATRTGVDAVYSDAVASSLNLIGTLSTNDANAATAAEAGHALAFLRATEALSQEDAILDGVTASGQLSAQERVDLFAATAVRDSLLSNEVAPYLPAEQRAALEKLEGSPDWAAMSEFESDIPAGAEVEGGKINVPRGPASQAAVAGRVLAGVRGVENQYLAKVGRDGPARNHALLVRVLLTSALALVAVVAVGMMSFRITRSLIGRMSSLRATTLEVAQDRLPALIARLRTEGSRADVSDLPHLDYGRDELGMVAEAFNTAQRTAVRLALEQAEQREGARLVFLNMSRRTQILVHRQLAVIDAMERKEQDPELLSDLYRVDHLATRMRRNAESLTVLSGSTPRRRWKHAVPLEHVLRSAVSEVEGYTRVVVEPLPPVAVTGPAVGDTIHLIAELIENGVTFSPPHTEVRVRAVEVAQGVAVEVEDRGLGLTAQEYAAANNLLHNPQEFSFISLGEDPRMGLYTVGQLARRHGITATLRASAYGGSMAVVVLPQALTEPAAETAVPPYDTRADRHLAPVSSPA